MRLREIYDRLIWCKEEYWAIPKTNRIECGLRTDYEIGYSGDWSIKVGEDLITKGFRGVYPIVPDEVHKLLSEAIIEQKLPNEIDSLKILLNTVEPLVENLEKKIKVCKASSPEKKIKRLITELLQDQY